MNARSTQAHRFGYEIGCDLGLRHADVHWTGKKAGSFGGWRLEWTDGPTVPTMRTLVEPYADRFPAVPVAELGFDRCRTRLAEATALLLYVDRDWSWVDCIETPMTLSTYDAVDWPERAERVWYDRANALLRHTPDAESSVLTAYALRALADQARVSWSNALAWLDRLVAENQARTHTSNVVDLASRRQSHLACRMRQRR